MNCPGCGAAISLKPNTDGFKCEYCHAVFFPGEQDDGVRVSSEGAGTSSEFCPVCSQPLVPAMVAKVPVLTCVQCNGLLLPMQVLPSAIEELRAQEFRIEELNGGREERAIQTPADRGDLNRSVHCPKCHGRMETHFYAGPGNVIVDSCGECFLIWLDRGELTRIAHAPDGAELVDSD